MRTVKGEEKKTKKPGGKSKWSDARASRIRREEKKSGDKGIRERDRAEENDGEKERGGRGIVWRRNL